MLRQCATFARRITRPQFGQVNNIQQRGFASGVGKVNCWEAPTDIGKWKEEQIVIAVLLGWTVVIMGGRRLMSSGKEEKPAATA